MLYQSNEKLVDQVLSQYSAPIEKHLRHLRAIVIKTAQSLQDIGELEETLKWGQLSFVTKKPKTGSTIRIDAVKQQPQFYAMYFHCQTNLVDTFRQMYPDDFNFEGNRALIFKLADKLPEKQLSHCIALALTYHVNK